MVELSCKSLFIVCVFLAAVPRGEPTRDANTPAVLRRSGLDTESAESDDGPPRIVSPPSDLSVMEGDTVMLPCSARGIGSRVRIWKRLPSRLLFSGNVVVSRDPLIRVLGGGASLHLHNVTGQYEGEYLCQISHAPDLTVLHRIRVLAPPAVTPDPSSGRVIARRGRPVTFGCHVTGSPKPVVTWTYERGGEQSTVLPPGVRVSGSELHVASADLEHAGTYRCTADNDVGEPADASLGIKVLYAPEIIVEPDWLHGDEGATVDFRCDVRSNPPSHVTWEKGEGHVVVGDGDHVTLRQVITPPDLVEAWVRIQRMRREDLGSYKCKAKNSVGEATRTVEVSGLAEPASLKGKATGDTSFALRWTTRSYSRVLEYQLKVRRHRSGDPWTDVVIPADPEGGGGLFSSQQYEVTGLDPSARYEAVLQAHNAFGWNRPSTTLLFGEEPPTTTENFEELETDPPALPLYDADLEVTDPDSSNQESSSVTSFCSRVSINYRWIFLFLLCVGF